MRAHKAPEEIEGVRESVAIADACFDRLLEVARIGITEREIGAAMYERCYALGGEDPLFLSMYPERRDGRVEGRFGPPVDRVLERGEQLVFSFELVGRMGYWMEFARMVVFGEPTELQQRMNAAVIAGLEAGAEQMRPGRRPDEVQAAITSAVAAHGADCSYWSGHGIGQDVIEEPWLGLEMVQDRDVPSTWELAAAWCSRTTPTPSTAAARASATWPTRSSSRPRAAGVLAEAAHALRRRVSAAADPILASVLQRRVHAITQEMATVLMRSSRSPIFNEIGDLVTVVFDADGRTLAQTEYASIIANGAGPPLPIIIELLRRQPPRRRRDHPQRRLHGRQPERRRRHLHAGLRGRRAGRVDRAARATSPTSAA